MKLTTRGFTLVELMIVIAIIGILAAALFPSLTAYLAKGRDTARTAGASDIIKAISASMVDQSGIAPATTTVNCANGLSGTLTSYLPKWPVDPVATNVNGNCTGWYGYGTGSVNNQNSAAISATFESAKWGITSTGVARYQGANTPLSEVDVMVKGSGSGYVIRN